MNYWFAYRVFNSDIDKSPGDAVLEGPFDSHEQAKSVKLKIQGFDMQKTSIFPANSKSEAEAQVLKETWMV